MSFWGWMEARNLGFSHLYILSTTLCVSLYYLVPTNLYSLHQTEWRTSYFQRWNPKTVLGERKKMKMRFKIQTSWHTWDTEILAFFRVKNPWGNFQVCEQNWQNRFETNVNRYTLDTGKKQSVTNIFECTNIFDPNIYSYIRSYQSFDTNIYR